MKVSEDICKYCGCHMVMLLIPDDGDVSGYADWLNTCLACECRPENFQGSIFAMGAVIDAMQFGLEDCREICHVRVKPTK